MTRRADITLGGLHLIAPHGVNAEGFARDVAHHLHQSLPHAGVTGDIAQLRVALPRAEAANPAAVADAILRAVQDGGAQ